VTLPSRHKLWVWGGALLLLAGMLAVVLPAKDWTHLLEEALEERNLVPAMLLFSAAYVIGTLLLVPSWIFPIAAGAAFGPLWGLLAAVASATCAALCAFMIARHVLRERLEKVARRDDTFVAMDKAVKREPWMVVALMRLSPVLPSGLKSYFLGLTSVAPLTYALASAAGMLPGIAIKVGLGHLGRDALSADGPWRWVALAAGLAATAAAAWLVGRFARKRLGVNSSRRT
jgi:uncharacterized membrane protein YdjX (TVP38/TMEM64 family)